MSIYNKIIDLQKLEKAWQHVKKNKPAAGVDHVTVEQFDESRKESLKQLHMELAEHTYDSLPIKKIMLYKGEKAREITLYSMRDKVVQQSIAVELNKLYDDLLSSQTYAYRNHRSALTAIEEIAEKAKIGIYSYYLKVDISHFFDSIQWRVLRNILAEKIREEDVLELIRMNACGRQLDEETGDLTERLCGIYQGSIIAPILSNIYLMEFDQWMMRETDYFVRYSDDMIILGKEQETAANMLGQITRKLSGLGLSVNQEKSSIGTLAKGVDFLGYHLDASGKSIPQKAESSLQERLEILWLTEGGMDFEEKIKKVLEIIGGWEQYFREEREVGSIIEYVAIVYAADGNEERLQSLKEQRYKLQNPYRNITQFLCSVWEKHGWKALEVLEYEQYYQIPPLFRGEEEVFSKQHQELLHAYRSFFTLEDISMAVELMQCYTDLAAYDRAKYWLRKKEEMEQSASAISRLPLINSGRTDGSKPIFTKMTAEKFRKVFVGREDAYAKEEYKNGMSRHSELQPLPLTEKEIAQHLNGEMTVGTYIQRPNGTVHYIVFDVDVSKSILLKHGQNSEMFQRYHRKAQQMALEICDILKKLGLKGYLEDSGNRGYHVWLFLTEWIPVRYANMFCEVVQEKIGTYENGEISLEFFPNKTRLKPGKFGQALKLPYGMHIRSGQRSFFLDDEMQICDDIDFFIDSLALFSLTAIKKILAVNTGMEEQNVKKKVDGDLEAFGKLDASIGELLKKCNLMCYLCQKARKTGYLTHFERLSVLYVFGHIGEEGKVFVHQIMSYTLNYKYNVTEKFIRKIPEKPISCIKLRDQYKQITAEYGCNCTFKRTKNCYPSPVLHAIESSNDLQEGVTLPISRTLTKEKEKKVLDEINIHSKAQELAGKILELKKQKRSVDKSIRKLESNLEQIFDQAGIEALEIEMGMLVRRKKADGYEWLIEI